MWPTWKAKWPNWVWRKIIFSSPLVLRKVDCICQKYMLLDKPGLIIKLIWTNEPELWHCDENITFDIPFLVKIWQTLKTFSFVQSIMWLHARSSLALGFLRLISTATCLHTKFLDKTRLRRGQNTSRRFRKIKHIWSSRFAHDSLKTRSCRLEAVLRSPHTVKTRSRCAKEACIFSASWASLCSVRAT